MEPSLLRHRNTSRGLRLWPVGSVLALAFVAALVVAGTVFLVGWDLLAVQGLKPERRLTSKTLFELVKLSFGVVAGAGALVALVVAYRRQRVDEDGARRDTTRLHSERFDSAVSRLGDAAAAVRLGGVHSLARLADDAPTRDLRQTCIDVLCAYLRLPYTAETDLPEADAEARREYLALREVRHTVVRLVRDRLRLADEHPHSWQGHDFDFTGVVFDGGDFSFVRFSGGRVDFGGAVFASGLVSFQRAVFCGAEVNFRKAVFSGGRVSFLAVKFAGGRVVLGEAVFSGGEADFSHARFLNGLVNFGSAVFAGGLVNFRQAVFSGAQLSFTAAVFSGGLVFFEFAEFSAGELGFSLARFSGGRADFAHALFWGGAVDLRLSSGVTAAELNLPTGAGIPAGLLPPSTSEPVRPEAS